MPEDWLAGGSPSHHHTIGASDFAVAATALVVGLGS